MHQCARVNVRDNTLGTQNCTIKIKENKTT